MIRTIVLLSLTLASSSTIDVAKSSSDQNLAVREHRCGVFRSRRDHIPHRGERARRLGVRAQCR